MASPTAMESKEVGSNDLVKNDESNLHSDRDVPDARGSFFSMGGRPSIHPNERGEPMQEDTNVYEYNMRHTRRGTALLINNKHFQPHLDMGERKGTDVDAKNLYDRFRDLGFDVSQHNNLTKKQMTKVITSASLADHSEADCFVMAILSHGDDGIIYGTDDYLEIITITELFRGDNSPTLHGKPKLFFFQACRGSGLDAGKNVCDAEMSIDMVDAQPSQRIPLMADFLLAYSVVPGYYSWRNSENGSWFVQALCRMLKEYGREMDLLRLLTRVNYIVSREFESNAARPEMSRKKQIPSIVSMLTKDIYFR